MSNHAEFSSLSNTQKDILKRIDGNFALMKWMMIILCITLGVSLINLVAALVQLK